MSRADDENPTGALFELFRQTREDQGKSLDRIERRLEEMDKTSRAAVDEIGRVQERHSVEIGGLLRWRIQQEEAQEGREKLERAWRRVQAPALVISAAGVAGTIVGLVLS